MGIPVFEFYDLTKEVSKLRTEVRKLDNLVRENNNMFHLQFGPPDKEIVEMKADYFKLKEKLSMAIAQLEAEYLKCIEVHEEAVKTNTYPLEEEMEKEPYFKGRMHVLNQVIKQMKGVKDGENE